MRIENTLEGGGGSYFPLLISFEFSNFRVSSSKPVSVYRILKMTLLHFSNFKGHSRTTQPESENGSRIGKYASNQ